MAWGDTSTFIRTNFIISIILFVIGIWGGILLVTDKSGHLSSSPGSMVFILFFIIGIIMLILTVIEITKRRDDSNKF